jgi:outer membrane protein assembly factor BamB
MKRHIGSVLFLMVILVQACWAVTSVITRHETSDDFLKGEVERVIVDSSGTLRLAPQSAEANCGERLKDVWSIHTMYADKDGVLYLGTGPNAKVFRYAQDRCEQVYPADVENPSGDVDSEILNEHVFAVANDVAGRLLVAVSGETGKLIRLNPGKAEVVFEDKRVRYIFAIALDQNNNIYLGTGPEGLLFRLDPFCQSPELIYDAQDKSLLSLAIHDNTIYAGSDERGLVYKIDPEQKRATVLYDSEQDEVTSLLVDDAGNVYAASSSAQAAMAQLKAASGISLKKEPGRPDRPDIRDPNLPSPAIESLQTPNNDGAKKQEEDESAPKPPMAPMAKVAGHIYKITPEGFVTDIFSEIAVLYSLARADGTLWLGTGNKGQLYSIDPETEEKGIVFEDKTSSQITSIARMNGTAFLGLSNPARLMRLEKTFASTGTYESPMIDAGQPAQWGKLQIEADIPDGCLVLMACRSGNIEDPNDATLSAWSHEAAITKATQLDCPVGRFCQYRLTLTADPEGGKTPEIREVTAAHVVPNAAPNVVAVKAERSRDKKTPSVIDIGFMVKDDNKDELEFTLQFRKAGRTTWIPLEDELDKPRYQWNGLTVEDGRYEVRVIASDRKSNSPETTLTGSRVSSVFVIDNTAPEIAHAEMQVSGNDVMAGLRVEDEFSVLGKVQYTVDSNEKWVTALPEDLVYDTLAESFTIPIENLEPGVHVIAFSLADDLENIRYKTYEVTIP